MPEPIQVGERVWLPTRIRANPPTQPPAMDEQALALEEEMTKEPGRVVSIFESGWAMVDRGSWGQFGCHVDELRRVNDSPTTLRFFGDPAQWDAPATDGRHFGLPPVGQQCSGGCGNAIAARDTGVLIAQLDADGSASIGAWHRICFLRNVLGPDADALVEGGA